MTQISPEAAARMLQNAPKTDGQTDTTGFDEMGQAMKAIAELTQKGEMFHDEPEILTSDIISDDTEDTPEEIGDDTDSEENEENMMPSEGDEIMDGNVDAEEGNRKRQKERQTLREEKRKRYAVIQEKRMIEARAMAAEARNQELEELLSQTTHTATYHFRNRLYGDLEKAKENKRVALEMGDPRALVDADIALTNALNSVRELEKLTNGNGNASSNYTPEPPVSYQQPAPQYGNNRYAQLAAQQQAKLQTEIASEWLETHPELLPDSRNFDRGLADRVGRFINGLDSELEVQGRTDQYYSDAYFNAIDRFIESSRGERNSNRPAASSYVGGVRNSYSPASATRSAPQKVTLTPEERIMLQNLPDVSTEQYLKIKAADMKKNNNTRR